MKIPGKFQWLSHELELIDIIYHHGENVDSGHFSLHKKHDDGNYYHHNDAICDQCNIEEVLPLVLNNVRYTSKGFEYGLVYKTTPIPSS